MLTAQRGLLSPLSGACGVVAKPQANARGYYLSSPSGAGLSACGTTPRHIHSHARLFHALLLSLHPYNDASSITLLEKRVNALNILVSESALVIIHNLLWAIGCCERKYLVPPSSFGVGSLGTIYALCAWINGHLLRCKNRNAYPRHTRKQNNANRQPKVWLHMLLVLGYKERQVNDLPSLVT